MPSLGRSGGFCPRCGDRGSGSRPAASDVPGLALDSPRMTPENRPGSRFFIAVSRDAATFTAAGDGAQDIFQDSRRLHEPTDG